MLWHAVDFILVIYLCVTRRPAAVRQYLDCSVFGLRWHPLLCKSHASWQHSQPKGVPPLHRLTVNCTKLLCRPCVSCTCISPGMGLASQHYAVGSSRVNATMASCGHACYRQPLAVAGLLSVPTRVRHSPCLGVLTARHTISVCSTCCYVKRSGIDSFGPAGPAVG